MWWLDSIKETLFQGGNGRRAQLKRFWEVATEEMEIKGQLGGEI